MAGTRSARSIAVLAALLLGGATAEAAGPVAAGLPSVTGVLQQGKRLTAVPGTWSATGTATYAFQWYRCDANAAHCSSIHGATKATYLQVAKDVGGTIALTVNATDSTGTTPSYAPAAGLVAPAAGTLLAASQPAVTGNPVVGQALQVAAPVWSVPAATSTYAWERCNANGRICAAIPAAVASTYTSTADDSGHTLLAAVTGIAGAATQTVLSLRTGLVGAAGGPVTAVRPSMSGAIRQGKKLTGHTGTWVGSGPITYAFQWYRCDATGSHCLSIHGATKSSYTQVAKDVGATIGLTVKATDPTGTVSAYAPLTGVVATAAGALAAVTQPTLKGAAAVGKALTIVPGTWTGSPTPTAFAWLRCNANGRLCVAIASATAASYTLTAGDRGHAIVATVQATAGTVEQTVLAVASAVVSD